MKDLEKLIKANTNETGVIDFATIELAINTEENNLIAVGKKEASAKVLSDIGLGDIESIKKTIDEHGSFKTESEKTIDELTTKATNLERKSALYGAGITDNDQVDYIMFNVNKRVTETKDFDVALTEFKTEKPQYFDTKSITFNTKGNGKIPPVKKAGWETILAERRPDVFGKDE